MVPPDVGEALPDVLRVARQLLGRQVPGVERDVLQELLHHRVQAPRADVLRALVHAHGTLGDGLDRLRQDVERDAFRLQQLHVLPYQRVPGLGQDADEILPRQGLELHADRKPALQLGDQVRRLGDVEGAGGDEQHVVGADHPVLGRDRRALDDRQQVALHPFARDVRAVAGALASGHLVELVQEHDARVLDAADGLGDDLLHVDELGGLLLGEDPARLGDADAPALRPRGHHVREHVLEVDAHLLHALAREDLEHRHGLLLGLQLDHALVETPGAQLRAQLLQGGVARGARADLLERGAPERLGARARQQQVEQPVLGEPLRLLLHLHHQLGLHHVDAELGQVADHRFDIATHITDFGVLGGFDLDERRLSKLGEPPRDLGFTNAGGADHDDVLRRHLVAQLGRQALAPPPVAQRDGHRALGLALADDVAIELQDDLRGGQPAAHSVSTVIWSFVQTQIDAATRIASVTIALASSSECATSARAAASAYGPPEPIPIRPSSGSMTSPVPDTISEWSRSATARSASSRRSTRSVRQSLASSTAARGRLPRCSSSLASKRAKRVKASAAVPAKPARMRSPWTLRTLRAPALTMVWPMLTCPSPAIATCPRCRTASTVVAWTVVTTTPREPGDARLRTSARAGRC